MFENDPERPEDDPRGVFVGGRYFGQGQCDELCWAACTQMLLDQMGRTVPTLCQVAGVGNGRICCAAANGIIGSCNEPIWPDNTYRHYGIDFLWQPSPLSLANIIFEVNHRRPIQPVLLWEDGTKHVVLITGYYPNGDVQVKDPLYGEGRVSYDYVAAAYDKGSWWGSYYYLRKKV